MNASTKIEIKPFGDSPEYRATEIYRGIEIQVVYSYLVNPTSKQVPEETLGWRFCLPDASYWMYKFPTPEEAFLKGREAVDLRLQQGTLVPNIEPKRTPPVVTAEGNLPEENAVASPKAPTPVYESISGRASSGSWNKRAGWGLALGILGTISAWGELKESHSISSDALVICLLIILVPINWALVYGTWSFVLWLYRCITLNRSKTLLWNQRASWAIILTFVIYIPFTIYYYWGSIPNSIGLAMGAGAGRAIGALPGAICGLFSYEFYFNASNPITAGIGFFPYAIFFFYGMVSGLTYLRRSR